jgi:hypothetical protein
MKTTNNRKVGLSYRLLIMGVIMGLIMCFIGSAAVYAAEPAVTRTISDTSVTPGQTFDVTINFAAPADETYGLGLHDVVPSGWTIQAAEADSTPDADAAMANSGAAEITWLGLAGYDESTAFTGVYHVTVPTNATANTYNFSGQLEYYVGTETSSHSVNITGDSSVTVSEEEPVEAVTVTIEAPGNALPGADFTATVAISEVSKFNVGNYTVNYDETVLRLDSVTDGTIGSTTIPAEYNIPEAGRAIIVNNLNQAGSGVTGSGSLAVLHFHVIGTGGQSSALHLSNGMLAKASDPVEEIEANWVDDSINIVSLIGDANEDGEINALDITKITRIILELDPSTPSADANSDGNIDAMDIGAVELIILNSVE